MVRTAQADDALERQFDDLLKRQAAPEVGLLVGKQSGQKATIFGTIKTPGLDGLEPLVVEGGASAAAAGGAGKGGKKGGGGGGTRAAAGGASMTLEADWVTEHARQVARMLPGGLSVLGAYVYCPDAAYQSGAPQLCALLASLPAFCLPPSLAPPPGSAAALIAAAAAAAAADSDAPAAAAAQQASPADLLLLHVDSSSRKHTLRSCPAPAAAATSSSSAAASSSSSISPSALKPCELRYAPTLGNMVRVRCWYGVDVSLPVPASAAELRPLLSTLVAAEAERIRSGVFAAGGALVQESAPCTEALAAAAPSEPSSTRTSANGVVPPGAAAANSSAFQRRDCTLPTYDLCFLPPLACQAAGAGAGAGGTAAAAEVRGCGLARLRGALQGVAFVSKRDSAGKALAELRADLLSSLSTRMELAVEEAMRAATAAAPEAPATPTKGQQAAAAAGAAGAEHPLLAAPRSMPAGCMVPLPRRVLLPWVGDLQVCDYLLEGEGGDAAADRARELLAVEAHVGQVIEPELPPPLNPASPTSPWRPHSSLGEPLTGTGLTPRSRSRAHASGSGSGERAAGSSLSCGATALLSLAVAAVAAGVGLMSMSGKVDGV